MYVRWYYSNLLVGALSTKPKRLNTLSRITMKGISWGVSIRLFSKAISVFVSYILLAHFMSPQAVGIILVFNGYLTLTMKMSSLGIDYVFTRFGIEFIVKKKYGELRYLFDMLIRYSIGGLLFGCALFIFLDYFTNWIVPLKYIFMVIIIIISKILIRVCSLVTRVHMNLDKSQIIDNTIFIATSIGTIFGTILRSLDIIFLLWALIHMIYLIVVLISTWKYIVNILNLKSSMINSKAKKNFLSLIMPLMLVSFFFPLNIRIDSFFISLLIPTGFVAIYMLASRIGLSIADSLRPISVVLFSSLTHTYSRNKRIFVKSFGITIRLIFMMFLSLLIALIPISSIILEVFFGEYYAIGDILLPIYIVIGLLEIIASILSSISIVIQRVYKYILALVIAFFVRVFLFLLVMRFHTNNYATCLALATIIFVSHIVLVSLLMIFFRDFISNDFPRIARMIMLSSILLTIYFIININNILMKFVIATILPIVYIILVSISKCITTLDINILEKAISRRIFFLAILKKVLR